MFEINSSLPLNPLIADRQCVSCVSVIGVPFVDAGMPFCTSIPLNAKDSRGAYPSDSNAHQTLV